jgi:putative hydrolase of HD superfamily
METKGDPPAVLLGEGHTLPLITAYFEFNQLKQLFRQGWLRRGVPPERCETVAEHTFSMAILAMVIADSHFPHLDMTKVLRMVLLHDFGEIDAGDITPADGVDAEIKHALERESVVRVLGKLRNGAVYVSLWDEYEACVTPEARYVKQIDRLDMALQAAVYQKQGLVDANEFLASAAQAFNEPGLQVILAEIRVILS